jgi:hypothetical protein
MVTKFTQASRIENFLTVTAVTIRRDDGYGGPLRHSAIIQWLARCHMQKDERDLLEVLKFELAFLKDGGYGRSPKSPWRPQYIFEDSLTCMNYDSKDNPGPCSDCVLMQLVPPESRSEKIPCRHIPFNAIGESLDSLYSYGTQIEIEETVEAWLRATIERLEEERLAVQRTPRKEKTPSSGVMLGAPLYQKQHPKCANPACPTAFHWTAGGKFFRFRTDPVPAKENVATTDSPRGMHAVRHYWLCELCSHVFTLVYEEEYGVVLKARWPELSATENHDELSAA